MRPHDRYPASYHAAIDRLVQFGAWGGTDAQRQCTRRLIAAALRYLRAHRSKHEARRERFHLVQIAGMWPPKNSATAAW